MAGENPGQARTRDRSAASELAEAAVRRDHATQRSAELGRKLRAVEDLLGPAVAEPLRRSVEPLEDALLDVELHIRDAMRLVEDQLAEARRVHAEGVAHVEAAVLDAVSRSKRSGRPLPEWAVAAGRWHGMALPGDEAADDLEPF